MKTRTTPAMVETVPPDDLVSVIIPARDVEAFAGRTLASVLEQTHRHLEVIVVDDGSTDGTADVVEDFARRDTRVHLLRGPSRGVSAARNLAIARSRGTWIAPIDADDLWHPDKLTRQLDVMQASGPEVGVVYCWSAGIDEDDRVILPAWNDSTASGDVLRDIVVSGIAGNGSTPLIRRTCLDAVGGYDEETALGEDWKLYTALAGVCRFAVVPQHLTGYRLRDDSASMGFERMEASLETITAWIRRRWPELPERLFRDRSHTVHAYLAVLAIREGAFGPALRRLGRAFLARPGRVFAFSYLRLFFLLAAHRVGIRTFRWQFWRPPEPFSDLCARTPLRTLDG